VRGLLPRDGAVIGIDLAEDKQAVAVVDHDVRVVARKTVRVKAFRLGSALDWAVAQARAKGFAAVAVACEPTGPRWLQVQRLCGERGAGAGVHPAAGVASPRQPAGPRRGTSPCPQPGAPPATAPSSA
jgi:hypothetical protein